MARLTSPPVAAETVAWFEAKVQIGTPVVVLERLPGNVVKIRYGGSEPGHTGYVSAGYAEQLVAACSPETRAEFEVRTTAARHRIAREVHGIYRRRAEKRDGCDRRRRLRAGARSRSSRGSATRSRGSRRGASSASRGDPDPGESEPEPGPFHELIAVDGGAR